MEADELVGMLKRTIALLDDDTLNAIAMLMAQESLRRLEARRMEEEVFGDG